MEKSTSDTADNYRAEILGTISLQLVISVAIDGKYVSPSSCVRLGCDNDGVVKHGNHAYRPLPSTQSQADVLRYFKDMVLASPLKQKYYHILGHLDQILSPSELSIEELANVACDNLADDALLSGVSSKHFIDSILPFEQVVVTVAGNKVSHSPNIAVTRAWGDKEARDHYHNKNIIHRDLFGDVYWDGLERLFKRSPEMWSVWATK